MSPDYEQFGNISPHADDALLVTLNAISIKYLVQTPTPNSKRLTSTSPTTLNLPQQNLVIHRITRKFIACDLTVKCPYRSA
jgi:hypothetical protein